MKHSLLLTVFLLGLTPAAAAVDRAQASCAVSAISLYSEAMAAAVTDSAQLIAEQQPGLAEIAELHGKLQDAAAQRQQQQFKWAARHDPRRLNLTQGVASAALLPWSAADEQRLQSGEPDYQDLSREHARLRKQVDAHPDKGRFHAYLGGGFLKSPDYLASVSGLGKAVLSAEAELQRCAQIAARPKRSLTE